MSLPYEFVQLLLSKLLMFSTCRKPCTQASFSYSPLDSTFQVTSLYELHLRPSLSSVKQIIIPYHASLVMTNTTHLCMHLIIHESAPTCYNAPQGSFSSICTTAHFPSWEQEDKHRTSPAYETGPVGLQKLHLNCRCHNHPDHKHSQNAAGGIPGWKLWFLFSAVFGEKGKNLGRYACLILSQKDMANNLFQISPYRSS